MTEDWVMRKILEALQQQPEHSIKIIADIDPETGATKGVEVRKTQGQPAEVTKFSTEENQ